jgi:hypothetical protein
MFQKCGNQTVVDVPLPGLPATVTAFAPLNRWATHRRAAWHRTPCPPTRIVAMLDVAAGAAKAA